MASKDKFIFESIETLSNAPAKWMIFKFKMQMAFEARGWGDHLVCSTDPDDEPLTTDTTTMANDKARRCDERARQQMKSKATLVSKLDNTSTQMIMHLMWLYKMWHTLLMANTSASQVRIATL